jgi:transposase
VVFAEFRLPWGKRYALVVVLSYSRRLWLQFYPRQSMEVLMRGLEDAFAFLGGVTTELLFDQMKAVVVDDQRAVGGKVLENAEFARFAAHWGFRIRACRPYRAQTLGQGGAAHWLCPAELFLRPALPQRRRLECTGTVLGHAEG